MRLLQQLQHLCFAGGILLIFHLGLNGSGTGKLHTAGVGGAGPVLLDFNSLPTNDTN